MINMSELPSTRGTAVVIEDDLDIRNLMHAVLREAGFDVHSAATGLEGVELVRSTNAVMVTTDIGLPDIDGYEVLRRIRDFSDCHVLVVTSRTAQADVAAALQWGADDYLNKPFRPRELRARLDAVSRRPVAVSAETSLDCIRGSIFAGSAIGRSRRPMTGAQRSPAFLSAPVSGRMHLASSDLV